MPLYTVNTEDALGNPTSATLGGGTNNGVATVAINQTLTYDPNTEREKTNIGSFAGGTMPLLSVGYGFDVLGNVTSRTTNATLGNSSPFTENYTYDGLNRLTGVTGPVAKTVCYDAAGLGNITYKSDIVAGGATGSCPSSGNGVYSYPGAGAPLPHAVSNIAGLGGFTYDADGNMKTGNGRTITWTSFNKPLTMSYGGNTYYFYYDADHNLIFKTGPNGATSYIDGVEASYPWANQSKWTYHNFVMFNGQRIGEIYRLENWTSPATVLADQREFALTDWQNSTSVLTDDMGNLKETDGYDAWGKHRFANGQDDTNNTITSLSDVGYTNQYQMTNLELIDLNAQMYDPFIGKMLSVDPAVANWLDPQAWNAYAYARNNPLRYTDPTGMTSNDPCYGITGCQHYSFVDDGSQGGPLRASFRGRDFAISNTIADALVLAGAQVSSEAFSTIFGASGGLQGLSSKSHNAIRNAAEEYAYNAAKFEYAITQASTRYTLNPNLLVGLAARESSLDPYKPNGGLFQIQDPSSYGLSAGELYSFQAQIPAAAKVLSSRIQSFGGSIDLGIASWTLGLGGARTLFSSGGMDSVRNAWLDRDHHDYGQVGPNYVDSIKAFAH